MNIDALVESNRRELRSRKQSLDRDFFPAI